MSLCDHSLYEIKVFFILSMWFDDLLILFVDGLLELILMKRGGVGEFCLCVKS